MRLVHFMTCKWFAFIALATLGYAQDDPVFKVNSDLVLVDVQVVSKKTGRTIGDLKRGDFEIYEDGVKQDIAFFSQNTLPLSIVFLFDLTESVQPVLKPLGAGALEALQHLKPEDETAVMVYAATAQMVQDFTTDRKLTVDAIKQASEMKSEDEAFFNQGIFEAADALSRAKNPSSRRVIIWLTDNVPNIPSGGAAENLAKKGLTLHTEADAFRRLFETGTVVSSLLERSAMSNTFLVLYSKNPLFAGARKHHPPGDVFKYADQTGGQVMKSGKSEVAEKLADLIDQIRSRYSLGYRAPAAKAPGSFYEIKLKIVPEVARREGQIIVKAKRGYYRESAAKQ